MQHSNSQDPDPQLEMSESTTPGHMHWSAALTQPHPGLREHLLAVGSATQSSPYPPPPSASHAGGSDHPYQHSGSHSPQDHIDPATGQRYSMRGEHDLVQPQPSKGKRELSTSKRAAQNRAAQRAFRQRKEGYIKKLEEQVREFQSMEDNYRALQNENYQLREYILNLQSRLLENQSDFPPAPSPINLAGGTVASSVPREPEAPVPRDGVSQLQAAAAQADARAREAAYSAHSQHVRADADEPATDDRHSKNDS